MESESSEPFTGFKERIVFSIKKVYLFLRVSIIYYFYYFFLALYTGVKYKKYIADKFKLNEIFYGKTVAIVGPADTAYRFRNGSLIDSYDVIIRFNNSYAIVDPGDKDKSSKIGSRTDILFHNFKAKKNNPGMLQTDLLEKQGVDKVISYLRYRRGHRGLRIFMKRNYDFLKNKLCLIPENLYKEIIDDLGSKPTVGHIAITRVLESSPAKVFITGFSFFNTPYAEGYRDYTSAEEQLERFRTGSAGHNPDNELKHFKNLLKKTEVEVKLDPYLEEMVGNK